MTKIIRNIVLLETSPDINNIWLHNGELFYYNGKWVPISSNKVNIDNAPNEEASITAPIIKVNNTPEDLLHNILICSKLSTTETISVNIEGTINNTRYDVVGTYYNGIISILEGNEITIFDIDFNTGSVTIDSKYNISKLLPYVNLEIGDSETVKAYNKEHLQTGSFFVALDYGFGTGTWNSTLGGQANIVTASGNTVFYTIGPDGSVSKLLESPDLYYEYVQAGGQKSPIQFMIALKNLIDT